MFGHGLVVLGLCLFHLVGHVLELWSFSVFLGFSLSLYALVLLYQHFRATCPLALAKYLLHVLAVYHLLVEEQLRQGGVSFLVFDEQLFGALVLVVHDLEHLVVDDLCRRLTVRTLEGVLVIIIIADVWQLVAHAGVGYHSERGLGGTLQVVHGSRGYGTHEELLRGASAKQRANLVELLFLCRDDPFLRNVPCRAEGLATWHDGHLHERVGVSAEPTYRGVSGLVDGYGALLVGRHHLRLLLQSAHYAVHGVEEVLFLHGLLVVPCGYQRGLVADVGNVGSGESRGLAREIVDVDVVAEFQRLEVHEEYGLSLGQVRQVDVYLPVESSGTQQSLVEHVGAVGGGEHYHARVGAESVHLGEQGVKCVLALVVAAHRRVLRPCSAHGVNLVDEDDARRLLLGLGKHVAHAARAHADEHLHEVGTRHGEERHASLSGHGLGQQGLTCSRRADEQCARRNLSSEVGVFLRVLQEVDNLLHLLLGAFLSGHVLEGYAHLVGFLIELCLALADAEDASATAETSATAHAAAEHPEEEEEEEQWAEVDENAPDVGASLVVVAVACELVLLLLVAEKFLQLVHGAELHADVWVWPHLLCGHVEHRPDVLRLDKHLQRVVALVYHHALRVAFVDVSLEVAVVGLLA